MKIKYETVAVDALGEVILHAKEGQTTGVKRGFALGEMVTKK